MREKFILRVKLPCKKRDSSVLFIQPEFTYMPVFTIDGQMSVTTSLSITTTRIASTVLIINRN